MPSYARRENEGSTGTSILRRTAAPVCDAILEACDFGDRLRELEPTNSFVIALDSQRSWYRITSCSAKPRYRRLLYNLGCNGVDFIPSIHGGRRLA